MRGAQLTLHMLIDFNASHWHAMFGSQNVLMCVVKAFQTYHINMPNMNWSKDLHYACLENHIPIALIMLF